MKKTVVVLTSILAILLSACTAIFSPTPGTGPTVDAAGTADAQFKTAVVESLTAQPTLPGASASETATFPVESPVVSVTDTQAATLAPTETFTLPPLNLTTTPATATSGPANLPTSTASLAAGQFTASPTLGIRTYGTLPPAVPFSHVVLINKAKAEAYISLQVTMPDGKHSIIEYPVEGRIKIQAPVGYYLYVAWVGGNKMVGNFQLSQSDEVSITLFKDKVVVK